MGKNPGDGGSTAMSRLPYGQFATKDGGEVLFDRHYFPIYMRKDGRVTPLAADAWVDVAGVKWFWSDKTPEADRKKRIAAVLLAWGVALAAP